MRMQKKRIFTTTILAAIIAATSLSAMDESDETIDISELEELLFSDESSDESYETINIFDIERLYIAKYLPIAHYLSNNGLPREIICYIFSPLIRTVPDFITRYKYVTSRPRKDRGEAGIILLKEFKQSCSLDLMNIALIKSEFKLRVICESACHSGENDVILLCLNASEKKDSRGSDHRWLCTRTLEEAVDCGNEEIVIACLKSAGPLAYGIISENFRLFSLEQRKRHPEILKILDFVVQSKKPELLDEYLKTRTSASVSETKVAPASHSKSKAKRKPCIVQ